jgi:hypothetical protein
MKKLEIINQLLLKNADLNAEDLGKLKVKELEKMLNNSSNQEVLEDKGITKTETDKDWSDYVMTFFTEDELKQNMPTCDGLRRVFKLLVGDIVTSEMGVLKAPTTLDPTASVLCTIIYIKHGQSLERKISDVFDVNQDNTPWPYCKSSVGTAATKAEARALRKGLGLVRIYSAEEIQEGLNADELQMQNQESNRPISDSARIAISTMSNKLGLNPSKLINYMGINKDDTSMLSYSESHLVLAKLNAFSRGESNGGESVPSSIKSNEIIL